MKKLCLFLVCFLITGCMQPLYETDYPLYRQYKYWESADNDWQNIDYFQIQSFRYHVNGRIALRLIPQRNGLPSTQDGYIQAAQKAAFNLMTEICQTDTPSPLKAQSPLNGRILDRFFYQYADASVGITFSCRNGLPKETDLIAEQQKWSLAVRHWDSINGYKAFVDTLPAAANGHQEIRIRLFGGNISDNKRLARRIIEDTCPNSNFKILSDKAGFDIVPKGKKADIISDENVRIYGFTCTP